MRTSTIMPLLLKAVGVKIWVVLIFTCAIATGGLLLGVHRSGFWSAVGWIMSVGFGVVALFQTIIMVKAFHSIIQWQRAAEQRLRELEDRDAELFAQGKSFEEITSQYNRSSQTRSDQRQPFS